MQSLQFQILNLQKQPSRGAFKKRIPKIRNKFTGENPRRSTISLKLQINFHWSRTSAASKLVSGNDFIDFQVISEWRFTQYTYVTWQSHILNKYPGMFPRKTNCILHQPIETFVNKWSHRDSCQCHALLFSKATELINNYRWRHLSFQQLRG